MNTLKTFKWVLQISAFCLFYIKEMVNGLPRFKFGIGILSMVLLSTLFFHKEVRESLADNVVTSFNVKKGNHNAYTTVEAQLLSNATQIEGFTTNLSNPASPEFRNSWAGDRFRNKVIEALVKTRNTQYVNISKNLLVHYRKSDLIFPFHYYW